MVKTRLGKQIGERQTAFLARAFLMDMLSTTLRIRNASVALVHWPPDSAGEFEEIIYLFSREEKNRTLRKKSADIILMPQEGSDLGESISRVTEALFARGTEKILIVGSDIPQLDPLVFRAALKLLSKKQVVLGPTFDGGYYLVGLNAPVPEIFNGISWGSPSVYKETCGILETRGVDWQELELTYDIDSPDDLEQLCCEIDILRLTGENWICYHTERCLKNLAE
jgi:rSAM/selenodomain-associated transferase 1